MTLKKRTRPPSHPPTRPHARTHEMILKVLDVYNVYIYIKSEDNFNLISNITVLKYLQTKLFSMIYEQRFTEINIAQSPQIFFKENCTPPPFYLVSEK